MESQKAAPPLTQAEQELKDIKDGEVQLSLTHTHTHTHTHTSLVIL